MAATLIPRVTWAGGQAGRGMSGRSDTARYQIAAAVMENYVTTIEGAATRSPGTMLVLDLKDQSRAGRLVPFRYASDDYYMLVINGGKARFVRQGGVLQNDDTSPYEMAVPFSDADTAIEAVLLAKLRAANSGNKIYVAWTGKPQQITRAAARDWTCADYVATGGPVDPQNLDTGKKIKASAVAVGAGVTLSASGTGFAPFTAGQVGAVYRLDEADLSLVPLWAANETGLSAGVQRRRDGRVYEVVSGTDAGLNAPDHTEGDVSAGAGKVTWRFLHPGYGFVRLTAVASGTSATCEVLTRLPDSAGPTSTYSANTGTHRWWPPAWSADAGYPTNVAFDSPRLGWYGLDRLWQTVENSENDMTDDGTDTGAITVRLRAPDASLPEIQWAVPSGALMLGTSDLEWSVRGASLFDKPTSKTIRAIPESTEGSRPQVPARVDGGVMFVGKSGRRLHYGRYDRQQQIFDPEEVSVWARDLFKADVVKMAWQRDPHRILWIVLADGSLLAFTFMPKQQIAAFAPQPRENAFFEDVEVLPSTASGLDEVYFIVRRTIDGETRRFVEQLGPYFTPQDVDNPTALGAWFLDCALRYQGAPTKTITGLPHLEGQTVGVFADGRMQKRKVVSDGEITLDRKASDVLVGIPLTARLKDLPRELSDDHGPSDGKQKTLDEAVVKLLFTGGGKIRANDGAFEPLVKTGRTTYGQPIPLTSGARQVDAETETAPEVALEIVNDDAMPCTVLGMSPRIGIEENMGAG